MIYQPVRTTLSAKNMIIFINCYSNYYSHRHYYFITTTITTFFYFIYLFPLFSSFLFPPRCYPPHPNPFNSIPSKLLSKSPTLRLIFFLHLISAHFLPLISYFLPFISYLLSFLIFLNFCDFSFIVIYLGAMHLLVFVILYFNAHYVQHGCDPAMDALHRGGLIEGHLAR